IGTVLRSALNSEVVHRSRQLNPIRLWPVPIYVLHSAPRMEMTAHKRWKHWILRVDDYRKEFYPLYHQALGAPQRPSDKSICHSPAVSRAMGSFASGRSQHVMC